MKSKTCLLVLLLILFSCQLNAYSHPHDMDIFNSDKFAKPAMKSMCSVCHESPSGGGPRNPFGKAFEANGGIITNDLREKFPELFDLLKILSPRINRVKPSVYILGQETKTIILGANFSADSVVRIDGVDIQSKQTFVSPKQIDVIVTFDKAGKHTFQIANPDKQVSNVFKVKVKPAK